MNGFLKIKNRVSSRLLAKIRVSQVFWEPIKNRASPRSVLLKAVYLEALLYIGFLRVKWNKIAICAQDGIGNHLGGKINDKDVCN